MFCKSLTQYLRRKTIAVNIGHIPLGGDNPIRLQSMINVSTTDIDAAVNQCIKIAEAGAAYVRATAQGVAEANALKEIRTALDKKNINIPLIADVHFNPKVAEIAARHIEKVRINPGNFIDKRSLETGDLSNAEYDAELKRLESKFLTLLDICKQHNTALRIGVNHGSLSERIMNRYGNTPQGMVESAMEFLRICKKAEFNNVVISMKSSNTRVMVYAYRLMANKMYEEDLHFPFHLGVTEAGDGEDGRIKSAVGIGTLLADGIGDTIRVSLTEAPEKEIPVEKDIVDYFRQRENHEPIQDVDSKNYSPYEYKKRKSHAVMNFGGIHKTKIVADISHINPIYDKDFEELGFIKNTDSWEKSNTSPDAVYVGSSMINSNVEGIKLLSEESGNIINCNISHLNSDFLEWLAQKPEHILILSSNNLNAVAELRACFLILENAKISNPVIIARSYTDNNANDTQIKAACDFGALFLDGFGDALLIQNKNIEAKQIVKIAFAILQATRVRFSKTEYIACPGCGRTLYNIEKTLSKIREETDHLKHLKIAVMGCIVNGIGEMADADYGYVGAGPEKISLYKNKELVKRNIPQEKAVDELIKLIKENGDWK